MKRPEILTVALVAPALAVPAVAVAATETPVMALFREWTAAKVTEESAYNVCCEDDEAWQARFAVEKRLILAPCQTSHDWLLKITARSNYGDGSGPDSMESPQLWAEARALVRGA